jgi:hypothetical protein
MLSATSQLFPPNRCDVADHVNPLKSATIGKAHADHNESALPPIASDARTLRHFSRVPDTEVDAVLQLRFSAER